MINRTMLNALVTRVPSRTEHPLRCDYPLLSESIFEIVRKSAYLFVFRFIPYCVLSSFFHYYGRLEIKGVENIPANEGLLIASNHLSFYDPPLLATILPRGCLFMAKHEVLEIPFWKYLIRYYAFPVNRQRPGANSIKTAVTELACAKKVVIFPAGTRRQEYNAQAKNGIGLVIALSGAKVVPVYISGTDHFSRPGSIIPKRARVTVTFGKAMTFEPGAEYEAVSLAVMESIQALSEPS